MRRGLVVVLVLAVAGTAGASARAAGAATPRLAILDTVPLSLRGTGFLPRERVTVTAFTRVRRVRTVTADARGRMVVRFRGIDVSNACLSWTVRAVGSRGSRSTLKVIASCPPPPPDAPAELQPADR